MPAPFEISPHVVAVRIPFRIPAGPGTGIERFVYAFVLLGERTWLLDTGVAGSEALLLEAAASRGRPDVRRILLSHGHVDHLGSARALKETTGALIAAHPAERHWIEDIDRQSRERPVPGFHQLAGGCVAIDEELVDGQRLELGPGLTLRVLCTPGHSPGSTSFLLEREGILFSGDAVPVSGDMPVYDDALASARSVQRLRELQGVRVLLSSWDDPRRAEAVAQVLAAGADVIAQTHRAVRELASETATVDPMALTRAVVERLGLPAAFANPMVARTVMSHYGCRESETLLG
jgi:hydroxyacylglutathione hydrolase